MEQPNLNRPLDCYDFYLWSLGLLPIRKEVPRAQSITRQIVKEKMKQLLRKERTK